MALLDLQSADGIRRGYCLLRETFGGRLADVIIQAAAGAGLITCTDSELIADAVTCSLLR
jgi:hypothetical protein